MNSYDNTYMEMEVTCDPCGFEDIFHGEYLECTDMMKAEGWKIFKDDDQWCHKCPTCVEAPPELDFAPIG